MICRINSNLFRILFIFFLFLGTIFVQAQNTNYGSNSGTGGAGNTNFGSFTGASNHGVSNTFLGAWSGRYSVGNYNFFGGSNAGLNSGDGDYNVFLGSNAGKNADGQRNIFIGYASGYQNSGNNNFFAGMDAGYNSTNGSHNVFLGYRSGYLATGSSNIFLGYQAGYNETGSNKLYIDNSSTASPLIWGDFASNVININGRLGIGTNSPIVPLHVRTTTNNSARGAFMATGSGDAGIFMDAADGDLNGGDYAALLQFNDLSLHLSNYGSNPIYFNTALQKRMIIGGNGYVGIGTTTPTYPLHVTSGFSGNWQARFTNGNSNVYLAHQGGYGMHINTGGTNSGSRYGLEVRNADQTHFFVRDDGLVGIGSNSPSGTLDVQRGTGSGGTAMFRGTVRASHFNFDAEEHTFIRGGKSTSNVYINDNGGKVGIGHLNPEQILHVDGASEIMSTGTGAGFKFRDRGSTSNADDWVWYSNNNIARFWREGTGDLMAITTDGSVGIGTNAPIGSFNVNRTGADRALGVFTAQGTGDAGIYFDASDGDISGGDYGSLRQLNDLTVRLDNFANSSLHLGTNQEIRMTVAGNGNVGIGLTDPAATLDVVRGTASNGTAVFRGSVRSSHFNYSTDEDTYIRGGKTNSDVIINDGGGYVAIGHTGPTEMLDVAGNAKISGNLILDGDLVYGQGIDPDPQASRLLALDGFNKMVYHELNDVRNPWGLRFVQDALGTGLNCLEFEDLNTNLTVEVDVLDIHGNLLLGNNGYIDDRDTELANADQIWAGQHVGGDRDDWIHIAERIELSSNNSVGEGVVIFGKNTTSTQFLNLTQDGNDSYLANSTGLSSYFLKATGRNITLGGDLSMPVGSTATFETLTVNQNATINGQIATASNGTSANWHEAYTQRGSQIAGNGLLWDGTNYMLSVDEGSLSISAIQVTDLPWGLNTGVLTYTGNAKVSNAFEAQNLKLTGLGVGDKSLDKVMVISTDGTVKSVLSSEFDSGVSSPWTISTGQLDYTGTVEVDGALASNSLNTGVGTFSSITTSTFNVTALPKGNTYDRILVEDGTGIIGYRELNTFDFSPWTKVGDDLSYNDGNISTTKSVVSDVATNEVAFIARGAGQDNFRVYGNGDIKARDLVLDQVTWPDYVFKGDYKLRTIEEVERFVKEHQHLPDVPSETEILENGMSVGEMNKLLLQKVEELTLYIIEQNKTIKAQQDEIEGQKDSFAARLEALEQKIGQ